MLQKIDIRDIVKDHFETLVSFDSKRSAGDLALFYGVPTLAAALLGVLDVALDSTGVAILITALSIFTGLLLNLLLLVHSLIRKSLDAATDDERIVLRQLYCNISYDIFIAILALVPLLILAIAPAHKYVKLIGSIVIYFLVTNFVLTLLMILKRVHILLTSEFRRPRVS